MDEAFTLQALTPRPVAQVRTLSIRLVFLGRLEDLAGREFEDIAADAPLDWAGLTSWLGERYPPALTEAIEGVKIKVALNGALVADKGTLMLKSGDEIAFLPPVSGG